jgi:Fanconi-associated nuclease 1
VCHSIVCLSPPLCVHIDAAKYLLIRLCLRKCGKWHRLNSLKYQHELGEEIATALETLCVYPRQYLTEERPIKQEEREIIDLTLDEIDTTKPSFPLSEQSMAEAGPSSIKIEDLSLSEQPCGDLSFFAQDHTRAELSELLECLSLEELRRLGKDMKIRSFSLNVSNLSIPVLKFSVLLVQRGAIEGMLIKQASSQSILPFLFGHKGSKTPRRPVARKPLPRVRMSQCDRLRQMVIKILGTTQLPQNTLTWTDYLPHRNMCPCQRIRVHHSAET